MDGWMAGWIDGWMVVVVAVAPTTITTANVPSLGTAKNFGILAVNAWFNPYGKTTPSDFFVYGTSCFCSFSLC